MTTPVSWARTRSLRSHVTRPASAVRTSTASTKTWTACRPMKCGTRRSPPTALQFVIGMPPPSGTPTPCCPISRTGLPYASSTVRGPSALDPTMKNATAIPTAARAIPARSAHVSAGSPTRWNSSMTAMSRLAPNRPITPEEKTCWPIALKGSVLVLKWLYVPRAACTAMKPTSTSPVTAKTVPSVHIVRLALRSFGSIHASVAP
jgi:hypothetical protein